MGASSIEWTDATWNPLRGCELVSPGCTNCYAMKRAHRYAGPGLPFEGLTKIGGKGAMWTGEVRTVPHKLDEPLRWKEPRRVFVNSMSDLFHEDVPDDYIDRVFAVMALAPQHTFQILTKRAERLPQYVGAGHRAAYVEGRAKARARERGEAIPVGKMLHWPLPNVWLGVSVEDQERADERIPHLLRTPAAVRFLSCEPLLGAVRLPKEAVNSTWLAGEGGIGWVIVGGESGHGARPMRVEWASSLVEQCKAAGVSVFVKQFGAKPQFRNTAAVPANETAPLVTLQLGNKGGDPALWPGGAAAWPRQFPRSAP